jgi:hypothetical protein
MDNVEKNSRYEIALRKVVDQCSERSCSPVCQPDERSFLREMVRIAAMALTDSSECDKRGLSL